MGNSVKMRDIISSVTLLLLWGLIHQAAGATESPVTCHSNNTACEAHQNELDTVGGVLSIEDCRLLCYDDDDCGFITYFGMDSFPLRDICQLFLSCDTVQPCSNCVSETRECYQTCGTNYSGAIDENLLEAITDVGKEVDCQFLCQANTECTFYTYFFATDVTSPLLCFLLSGIEEPIETCENCVTGPADCDGGTTVYSTTTTTATDIDPDVVFIGPGYGGRDGLSEVLLLPSLTPASCTPPPFPHGEYEGYVGTLSPAGPLLCGGYQSGAFKSSCYLLGRDGSWVTSSSQMTVERAWPAAAQLGDSWLVTGGYDERGNVLSSTEVLTGNSWLSSTPLPTTLYGHCMVQINSSHVFIAGGYDDKSHYTAAAYLFSSSSGYTTLPSMAKPKHYHACGMLGIDVWVGGGRTTDVLNKVETFSLTSHAWSKGPPLPIATSQGRMMTVDGSLLMFGNKLIWQLKTTGGEDYWDKVGEMETEREAFDILRMKLSDCVAWNIQ